MSGKDPARPGNGRIRDIEDVIPTSVPGERMAPTERVDTEAVPRAMKKRTPWLAWVMSFLVLGGVAFGVTWFLTRSSTPTPSTEPSDDADATSTQGDLASSDVTETASVDATDARAVSEETKVADAASEVSPEASDAGPAGDAQVDGGAGDATSDASEKETASSDVSGDAAANSDSASEPSATDVAAADSSADIAVVRDPAAARRLNAEGFAARKSGDHARARSLYAEALTFNPDDATPRYNLACELALAGEQKEALAALTYLYKLGTPEARKLLAAARDDKDFESLKDLGQFMRLTR